MRNPLMLLRAWSEVDACPFDHVDRPGVDDQFEWWLADDESPAHPLEDKETDHGSNHVRETPGDRPERV